jgi:hypothetical protein
MSPTKTETETVLLLPQSELRLLLALRRLEAATAPQLSRHLKNDPNPNTAQRLLFRLEQKGLVRGSKVDTNRIWELSNPTGMPALLEADASHLLQARYDCDPLALRALLAEIEKILKEGRLQKSS